MICQINGLYQYSLIRLFVSFIAYIVYDIIKLSLYDSIPKNLTLAENRCQQPDHT